MTWAQTASDYMVLTERLHTLMIWQRMASRRITFSCILCVLQAGTQQSCNRPLYVRRLENNYPKIFLLLPLFLKLFLGSQFSLCFVSCLMIIAGCSGSLLSGRYPFRTGVLRNAANTDIKARDCLLAKGLQQANFSTLHVRLISTLSVHLAHLSIQTLIKYIHVFFKEFCPHFSAP